MIIVSIICFAACLALTGVSLYYVMKFAIGHEAINIYDKINLWDVMMGEPSFIRNICEPCNLDWNVFLSDRHQSRQMDIPSGK